MRSAASGQRIASLILLGLLATAVWVHRFQIAQPTGQGPGPQVDTFLYFHPTAAFIGSELRHGRLPLWNPYQMAGQPYLGLHVPAILYPPNLLLLGVLPLELAMPAHGVLHLFIAGLFTWLFAGRIGLGAPARFTAALAFMLSGAMGEGFYLPPFVSTPAWFPGVLWALHGLAAEVRMRWAVALAGFIALAFLGGHVQGLLYMLQLGGIYALFALTWVTPRGRRLAVLGLGVLSGILAVGFSAPQLLPALELAADGVRGLSGVSFEQASMTFVTPRMLLVGLLGPLAPADLGVVSSIVLFPVLSLPLIACAVMARRQRAHWIFFLLGVVPLGLFLTGYLTVVFQLYYQLPLGNLFRGPFRLAFAYALWIALLLGIGIQGLQEGLRRLRAPSWIATALAAGVLLGVAGELYAATRTVFAHPALILPKPGAPPDLLEFLRTRAGYDRFFADVFWFDQRILRKAGMMNEVYAVPDYEPSMPAAYARFLGLDGLERPWHGDLHALREDDRALGRYRAPMELLDLMSVRWYATPPPLEPEVARALEEWPGGPTLQLEGATIAERPSALPRVYAVRRLRSEPDFDAALLRLRDPGFDPHHEAVVTDAGQPAGPLTLGAPGGESDRVSIESYEPSQVVIRAACRADCLVVLTDLHYPGWQLRVDGRERPIERVNAIFRGVRLEAGAHQLVYRYAPASFLLGIGLFGLASLIAAVGLVASRRRLRHGS